MSLNPVQLIHHEPLQPIQVEPKVIAQPEALPVEVEDKEGVEGVKTTREERLKRNKEILNKTILEQMRVAMQNHSRRMQEIAREEQDELNHLA
ncbi:MAG: hypothetical protein MJ218_03155 [Opitutales bacterium]|nr:hypothetical protein [Opitutales bacterium]